MKIFRAIKNFILDYHETVTWYWEQKINARWY